MSIPDATDRAEDSVTDLFLTLMTVEGRVLRLVREGDREIPIDDLVRELSILSLDLRRCYRKIVDWQERRDLSYTMQAKLRSLQDQCIWLYRKSHAERLFFQKLALETRLRELIPDEAFRLHQELTMIDDEEHELGKRDDAKVASDLLGDLEAGTP
jgi:hypothetical protein